MVEFKLIHPNAKFGEENRRTEGSIGYDLYTTEEVFLTSHLEQILHTGVCLNMSRGTYATVHLRSSTYGKYGIMLTNSTGIIDSDYQGEIKLSVVRVGSPVGKEVSIPAGTAIGQIVFHQCLRPQLTEVKEFKEVSERGEGGFGSTDSPPMTDAFLNTAQPLPFFGGFPFFRGFC